MGRQPFPQLFALQGRALHLGLVHGFTIFYLWPLGKSLNYFLSFGLLGLLRYIKEVINPNLSLFGQ